MEAMCGLICSECEYRTKVNCPGCIASKGDMFWGKCPLATCCIEKNLEHCGLCSEFVCETLHRFSYDKEQGDSGRRIENLRKRTAGDRS